MFNIRLTNKIAAVATIVACCCGIGVTAAMAQGPGVPAAGERGQATGQTGAAQTGTAASNQQPERDSNWGWLGLLGLAGLAGLRRPTQQTVVRQDKDARAF